MRAVLEREFVSQCSRPRAFLVRTLAGGAAVSVLAVAGLLALGDTPADVVGATAFLALSRTLFLLLAAATPALLVASLLAERRDGTLDLLLAAPVGRRGILLGKLVGRLGTVLVWAGAALPPLAMALLFGGTSTARVADTAAGLLGTALETGAVAMLVSAAARDLATGAVLAYLLPLLHWLLPGVLEAAGAAAVHPALHDLLRATTPLPFLEGSTPGAGLDFLLAAALLAGLLLPLAGHLLSREEVAAAPPRSPLPRTRLEEGLRSRLSRENPVAWKDGLLRSLRSRPLHLAALALLLAGEAGAALLHGAGLWSGRANAAFLVASFALVATLGAVQGASSLSEERSRGTLDLLRLTRLAPGEIARGKALGTGIGLGILLLVPLGHLALSAAAGLLHPAAAALTALAALLMTGNFAVHGVAWGVVARTPFAAVAGSASFAAVAAAGCATLCFLPVVVAATRAVRRLPAGFDFLEVVVLPAAVCGSPLFLLDSFPAALETALAYGSPGLPGGGAAFHLLLGGLALTATGWFACFRWTRLPGMVEREWARLSLGEEEDAPGERPRRAAALLRRLRAGREGR